MSIAFTRNGKNYELALDGSVKAGGSSFGSWTTNEDNALQVTAASDGSVFAQPARWITTQNRLSVTPEGGDAVEFLEETDSNIQFRLTNNRLVIDPFPDDEFSFSLTGDWSLTDDFSALQLAVGNDTLSFTGGLSDSESRFVWKFEATNDLKKIFALRFEGSWKIKKRDGNKAGVLATFGFEYTIKGQTTRDSFELPVEVTADADHGNRLLFTYQRSGSATKWGVAFAGRFVTKAGSILGYSAEMYDDNGQLSSRFTFSFKGKIKNGAVATRNSLQFQVTIAGRAVELTLSGRYDFTKSTLSFNLVLNTSTRTGEISSLTFGLTFKNRTNGTTVDLTIKADGSDVTVSIRVGADLKLGGSRKGSVYAGLDMKLGEETKGIDILFGVTLN